MNKTRNIKELLEILLASVERKHRLDFGLCRENFDFYCLGVFSKLEFEKVHYYFIRHLPLSPNKYSWKEGLVEPRVKWLKEQIEYLSSLVIEDINTQND
jgi:hypothetical protein